jgi:FtsH-binding integral membrane protein
MNNQKSKSSLYFRLLCCILALCLSLVLTWSVTGLHTPVIYDYGLTLVIILACLGLFRAFLMERKTFPSSERRSSTVRWFAAIGGIFVLAVSFFHDGLQVQVWYQGFPSGPVFGFFGSCVLLFACFLMIGIALKHEWESMMKNEPSSSPGNW